MMTKIPFEIYELKLDDEGEGIVESDKYGVELIDEHLKRLNDEG